MLIAAVLLLLNPQVENLRQPDSGTLTRPNSSTFHIPPKEQEQIRLRNTVPGDTVLPEIPTYEYQAHMSFQQNIDRVDSKVDRLSDRVTNVEGAEKTQVDTLSGLKDDRTEIKVWLKVLAAVATMIGGLVSRDLWLPWVKQKLAIPPEKPSSS